MSDVLATYILEGEYPLVQAAEILAGEQSTGTFTKVARESDEIMARHRAEVVKVEPLEPSHLSPLHGFTGNIASLERARVTLRFPLANFGPSIPNLLAAIAGNLFEIKELAAVRLIDLELPAEFGSAYPGPAFGVRGTRELVARPEGVLLGTIVKPSIGLQPDELAELVLELLEAGIDFIKDDELQGNGPTSPLSARVDAVMPVISDFAQRTGRKPMYAFNITDDIDTMARNVELLHEKDATCAMVCVNLAGLSGLEFVRKRCDLPIHGHRTMFGSIGRSTQVGIAFRVWQQLVRLCGADHIHTNGLSNKFYETDAEVLSSIHQVQTPLLGTVPALPVLSSGQWAGLADKTYRAVNTTDLLVLAGGGIHAHPDGPAAGVASMRAAWEAAERGISLERAQLDSAPLARAVGHFGKQ